MESALKALRVSKNLLGPARMRAALTRAWFSAVKRSKVVTPLGDLHFQMAG
jgi:hypothetical protein